MNRIKVFTPTCGLRKRIHDGNVYTLLYHKGNQLVSKGLTSEVEEWA